MTAIDTEIQRLRSALTQIASLAEQHDDYCCSKGCTGPGVCASGPDACVRRRHDGSLTCDETCNCPVAPYRAVLAEAGL